MRELGTVLKCKSFIECQLREPYRAGEEGVARPFVTISRQTGAGGITIGKLLGEYLREKEFWSACECPWTVFDKNLVYEVLSDNELSDKVMEYMAEDASSEIEDTLEEFFGLHPARWVLVRETSGTILRLARMGHVVLVGRGANVVTAGLPCGLHVRLIGSLPQRLRHVQEYYGFGQSKALEFLKAEDGGRAHYLRKYFGKDIDDPLLYDLVINTDRLSYDEAARMIAGAVMQVKTALSP